MKGTVLVVDDERNQREILGAILKSEGYIPLLASGGAEALRLLEREAVDLVITDLVMPGMTGEELIDAILARNPGMPILLSSAYGTIQTAVDAIKKGAYYYFEKPVDRARLLIIVERAIENLHLRESHRVLSEKLFPGAVPILGEHAAIREIKRILPRVARSESTILLTGESGTGKEVIARNVHSMSGRSAAPFLAVNCASLPDTLFESELFGHERGGVHRRGPPGDRSFRGRGRGDDLPRRDRRDQAGDPGEAAARLAGKGDPPDRRQGEHPRRRPDRRGHEPGSRRRRAGREVPGGPLLPVEHREAHPPAPAGPDRPTSPSSRSTSSRRTARRAFRRCARSRRRRCGS